MTDTHPVFGVILFALCFGGWPVFLFYLFHAHRYGVGIVFALAIVTFVIGSLLGDVGIPLHTPAPLYTWIALPYLLLLFVVLRRRIRTRSQSASAVTPK